MLSHSGVGDRILTNFVSPRISTQKKLRDRLLRLHSRIQKTQGFSESDRRGVEAIAFAPSAFIS
ncbi:MAG: hypothetical protein KME06_13395 [Kastovskya adunca ATA6-11-RM4]|nr:hypothetical protein [Kastovskya adunca ATA6-11-RM4]